MRPLRRAWMVGGFVVCALFNNGCGDGPRGKGPDAGSQPKPADVSSNSGTHTAKPVPSGSTDAKSTSKSNPEVTDKSASTNSVLLGSSELTAGIPGSGPLTIEQIRSWLERTENHQTLTVELPLGLSAGRIPADVLESNPLTRAKIELGRQLYFDTRLSADNTVSCASCHHPDEGYAKHTQFGVGIGGQTGNRNSPTSYNRILSTLQFWDGRAASLEEQAKGPIQNPIEMGNTHERAVETIKGVEGYRLQFDKVFPSESLTIDQVAKAIAAFERVIVTGPSAYDYHERFADYQKLTKEDFDDDPELKNEYDRRQAAAKAHPLSESAIRGRELFFGQRVNCAACHVGANLADEKYHNLGVGMDAARPDLGRFEVTKDEKDRGSFKTPTIRNVALTAPYMHDGSQKTLLDVVEHYNKGGTPNPNLSDKMKKLELTEQEKSDLVAFMEACTGAFPKVETSRLPQ